MNWKRIAPFALNLMIALPGHSQVQLFEADVSGIVPSLGVKWNQGITEVMAGFEYTIDGRTTLGLSASKPLKDTLSFDTKLKQFTVNPYLIFEFVEPDNLKSFSFAIRADLIQENTMRDTAAGDPGNLNNFRRTSWGGGPIFALRIFASEQLVIVPSAAYEIYYVSFHRDNLPKAEFIEDNFLWHDITGGCAFNYKINEFNGLVLEPKVIAKIGDGRSTSKDLINVTASLGYVRSF
jgi:hypothetical protein